MIALWKEWKLDVYLRKAWQSGIVLSGVSAGANCWFEECVTDSIPGNYTALECLGFLRGSCCPHYDSENKRQPSYRNLMKNAKISNGVAIDDNVALHYIGRRLHKVIKSTDKGGAYKVYKHNNEIIEERLEAKPLANLLNKD